jgi:hypothetical protein
MVKGVGGASFQLFVTRLPHFFERLLAVGKDEIALLGVYAEGSLQSMALEQVESTEPVEEFAVTTRIVKDVFHMGCCQSKVSKNDQPGP